MKAVNAGLRAVPTAFRTHQKSLESFATGLLTAPGLHMAVRIETACLYSLLPRLTGNTHLHHNLTSWSKTLVLDSILSLACIQLVVFDTVVLTQYHQLHSYSCMCTSMCKVLSHCIAQQLL